MYQQQTEIQENQREKVDSTNCDWCTKITWKKISDDNDYLKEI